MAHFLVRTTFTSPTAPDPYLEDHLAYLRRLHAEGSLLIAGPIDGDPGGLLVFEAATEIEVRAIMEADPYAAGGVFAAFEITPFRVIVGP